MATPFRCPRTLTTTTRLTSKSSLPVICSNISDQLVCFFRFPFFAADVLSCNAMVMQAICEGGWPEKSEEEEKEKVDSENDFAADKAENSMVQSILNKVSQTRMRTKPP